MPPGKHWQKSNLICYNQGMVKIRLTRTGKTHQPTYRLIATQNRTKRDGEALEYLGFYNPRTNPSTFTFDKERVEYWLKVGAQPTETVAYLLGKEGVIKVAKKKYTKQPGRKATDRAAKAEAAKNEPAQVEAKEEAVETPAETEKAAS